MKLEDDLVALGPGALNTYRRAIQGEKVSIATYNIAKDVLTTLGLLGDKPQTDFTEPITVDFIPVVGLSEMGEAMVDENKTDRNAATD